jgi:hypothetical protein
MKKLIHKLSLSSNSIIRTLSPPMELSLDPAAPPIPYLFFCKKCMKVELPYGMVLCKPCFYDTYPCLKCHAKTDKLINGLCVNCTDVLSLFKTGDWIYYRFDTPNYLGYTKKMYTPQLNYS